LSRRGGGDFREGASPPPLPAPLPFINTQGKGGRGIGYPTSVWLYASTYAIILNCLILYKEDVSMANKPLPDLKTFIENVNKKDKLRGKKVRFGFTKRKRKKP
jgi:hypothetical protein